MAEAPPLLFCFGLGFSGLAVADRLRARGWRVAGTSRNKDKLAQWQAQGIDPHYFSDTAGLARPEILLEATAILSSVAPGTGDPVLAAHGAILRSDQSLAWRLSTTGVYGDARGAWIDEDGDAQGNFRARTGPHHCRGSMA